MDWVREMLVDTEEVEAYREKYEYQQAVKEEANRVYYETYPDRVPEPGPVIVNHDGSMFLVKGTFIIILVIILLGAFKSGK